MVEQEVISGKITTIKQAIKACGYSGCSSDMKTAFILGFLCGAAVDTVVAEKRGRKTHQVEP